jgi:hypothetical protein
MVQFRRLDPLANAGPWQKHRARPVKSFDLPESAYARLEERRPDLIVIEGDGAVVGRPYRDTLEVHYAFGDVPAFRRSFKELFERCAAASNKQEAPRGAVIAFRDRPNRALAETLFWESALEEAGQWVEMDWTAVPEQPEPADMLDGGFQVREATDGDRDAIAGLEAEVSGMPRLSQAGIESIYAGSRWLRLVEASSGAPAGFVSLRSEPGGWGIIEQVALQPAVREQLREPLLRWAVAFLRNNGGRRQRCKVYLHDAEELAVMRKLGFTPGESGVDYTRPVGRDDVRQKVEARQAHGTLIKFGDWR